MKYSFSRRLGALVLAFALALSLSAPAGAVSPVNSQKVMVGNRIFYLTITTTGQTNGPGDLMLGFTDKNQGSARLNAVLMEDLSGQGDPDRPVTDPRIEVSWERVGGSQYATVDRDTGVVTAGRTQGNVEVRATATLWDAATGSQMMDGASPVTLTASFTVQVYQASMKLMYHDATGKDVEPLIRMNAREEIELEAMVKLGTNVGQGQVNWTLSNNSGYVTLSPSAMGRICKITAVQGGTVTVTATSPDSGVSASCTIEVQGSGTPVRDIKLSGLPASMTVGDIKPLTVTITPANATDPSLIWTCTQDNGRDVVRVEQVGKQYRVTALGVGTSTITATSVSNPGVSGKITVSVVTELTGLRIDGVSNDGRLPLTDGFTGMSHTPMTIMALASPSDALTTTGSIRWTSSDTSVVTVASDSRYPNGLYATLSWAGPGEATITVQSGTGDTAIRDSCKVIVPGVVITSDTITMTNGRLSMLEGQTAPLGYKTFGQASTIAGTRTPEWMSSDASVVEVDRITGAVTARRSGTATITLTLGNYEAECTITVAEDLSAVIEAGPINAGVPYSFDKLLSKLQSVCSAKVGGTLSYINNLAVASTEQGILHDEHHSADDTGAGVGTQDKYYRSANTSQGQRPLSDLSFVPRTSFSGTAEITFTGWNTNNRAFSGVIRIKVDGTGDVMYSSNESSPVSFLASDFNRVHPSLKSVSFTPPLESVGTLYYNYTSAGQPGTKVTAGATYYRTGNPNIDRITFVPAAGYAGTAKISYKGTDTSNRTITGVVTITVTKAQGGSADPADISYSVKEDSWVTFRPADFYNASRYTLGETLSYVRFDPPPSGEGTLFYNYRGFSNFDSMVGSTTSYYYSGSPALSGVSFVPTTTTPSQVNIGYTGYTVRGNTFQGTIHISLNGAGQQDQQPLHYTVFTGKTVSLSAADLNTVCAAATGGSLNSIQFTSLPGVSQGNLRYTRGNSSTPYSVSTGTRFYRTGSSTTANLIGNVYFQAASGYTGTVTIPFTGYSDGGKTFTDQIVISVTPPTSGDITYSGTTASPIRLSAAQIRSASDGALDRGLSYITFTNLPGSTAGKLYVGYSGAGTGTLVNTGTRYYASGYPGIDQISFVPRGRYSGQVSVGYTAVSGSGQSVTGRIVFSISGTGGSSYFNDMGGHTWAGPSVDYLYQNGVTNGITATTFGPNRQIYRCDFVLMLCRAFHFTGASGYSFADVPTGAYFAQAVAAAKQLGVVSGDGTNFRPYGQLTRQDAMVMIQNALNAAGRNVGSASTSVLNQFSDGGSVSGYARNAVSSLVQMGAVNGDNGRLNPHNPITRAEAAVILHFVMTM